MHKIFCFFAIALIKSASSSEIEPQKKFHSLIVPGLNGSVGRSFAKPPIVNTSLTHTGTLRSNIDLGQQNCINHFLTKLKTAQAWHINKKMILYGVSQGTATIMNALAQMTPERQEAQFAGIILQSLLGNPQNAVMHTAEYYTRYFPITYLPFASKWIPLAVQKLAFRQYNPNGPQTIESAKKISPNIPVVIMHNTQDFQLPIDDARQVYCTLIKSGHKNTYLIEVAGKTNSHFDILNPSCDPESPEHFSALQEMYKKHGLPYQGDLLSEAPTDLSKYQPSVSAVIKIIHQTQLLKEAISDRIDLTCAAAATGILHSKIII